MGLDYKKENMDFLRLLKNGDDFSAAQKVWQFQTALLRTAKERKDVVKAHFQGMDLFTLPSAIELLKKIWTYDLDFVAGCLKPIDGQGDFDCNLAINMNLVKEAAYTASQSIDPDNCESDEVGKHLASKIASSPASSDDDDIWELSQREQTDKSSPAIEEKKNKKAKRDNNPVD